MLFVESFGVPEDCDGESLGDLDDARVPNGEVDELARAAKPDEAKALDDVCVVCPKTLGSDVSFDGDVLRAVAADEGRMDVSLVAPFCIYIKWI